MILAGYGKQNAMQEIHVHVHVHNGDSKILFEKLDSLTLKIDQIMTKQERFDAILTRLDAVTTNIAGDFKTFVQEVKDGTVSDESLAKAESNITALEELAASKENPIPGETIPGSEGSGEEIGA